MKPWKRRYITLDGATIHVYKQVMTQAEFEGEIQIARADSEIENVFKIVVKVTRKGRSKNVPFFVEPEDHNQTRPLLLSIATAVASAQSKFMQRGATIKEIRRAQSLMDQLKSGWGFSEPDRGDLDNPNIRWRAGKPDYTVTNLAYMLGKTKNHVAGSLEVTVENLIKTWEMEATHVPFDQWTTINHNKYRVKANHMDWMEGEKAAGIGNYNWLLASCPKNLFNVEEETFESSHKVFLSAFPHGFPFEVLEVYSGPPKVAFTWRHWATFAGEYKGNKGRGEVVELTGFGLATLEDMKICDLEIYYDPTYFIQVLSGVTDPGDLKTTGAAHGDPIVLSTGCPFGEFVETSETDSKS